jgi:hypothetical protein
MRVGAVRPLWLTAVDVTLAATLLAGFIVAFPVIICVGVALSLYDRCKRDA